MAMTINLLQPRNRLQNADAVHAITMLKCEDYSTFIFRSDIAIFGKRELGFCFFPCSIDIQQSSFDQSRLHS